MPCSFLSSHKFRLVRSPVRLDAFSVPAPCPLPQLLGTMSLVRSAVNLCKPQSGMSVPARCPGPSLSSSTSDIRERLCEQTAEQTRKDGRDSRHRFRERIKGKTQRRCRNPGQWCHRVALRHGPGRHILQDCREQPHSIPLWESRATATAVLSPTSSNTLSECKSLFLV